MGGYGGTITVDCITDWAGGRGGGGGVPNRQSVRVCSLTFYIPFSKEYITACLRAPACFYCSCIIRPYTQPGQALLMGYRGWVLRPNLSGKPQTADREAGNQRMGVGG